MQDEESKVEEADELEVQCGHEQKDAGADKAVERGPDTVVAVDKRFSGWWGLDA